MSEKRIKIFILTEGGKKIGFGHITRCLSLFQAFKAKNLESKLIVNSDDSARFLLGKEKYISLNWLKEPAKALKITNREDIVIIDSYLANKEFYKEIATQVKLPVYLDDYQRINYPRGVVINANIYASQINYYKDKEKKYLLGIDYASLRKEFWKVKEKKINKKVENILVTFGGTAITQRFYQLIKQCQNLYQLNFEIVNTEKKKFGPKEMIDLMLKTDICIADGGQTLIELARLGVPSVVVAFGKDQLKSVKHWQKTGFIEYAGLGKDATINTKIKRSLNNLFEYNVRLNRNRIGRSLVDGKGSARIITKLMSYYEEY